MAQIFAARLGDPPGAVFGSALVHARTQPGIPDQVLGGGEAFDGANRGQKGHPGDQTDPGQLRQQGHTLISGRQLFQAALEQLDLFLGEVQGGQIALDDGFLGLRQRQVVPPVPLLLGKQIALSGRHDLEAVQDRVQAVFGSGAQAHHLPAFGHQCALVPDLLRRDPDSGQQTPGVQPGQHQRVFLVGLDLSSGDQRHVRGMDDGDRMHQVNQHIVDFVGIGGHFEDDGVVWGQMFLSPACHLAVGNSLRPEDLLKISIDACGDEVAFVDIETDETDGVSREGFFRHLAPPDADEKSRQVHLFSGHGLTHTFELGGSFRAAGVQRS